MPTWSDFVGPQLNTLVAIVMLGTIAGIATVVSGSETIILACVTGIAGIAGTLQRAPNRAGDIPPNGNGNGATRSHPSEPLRG